MTPQGRRGSAGSATAAIAAADQTINNLKYNCDINFRSQVSTQNKMFGARITYAYATAGIESAA